MWVRKRTMKWLGLQGCDRECHERRESDACMKKKKEKMKMVMRRKKK